MKIDTVNPQHARDALRDALRVVGMQRGLDWDKTKTYVESLADEQVEDIMVNTLFRMHPYQQGLVDKLYNLTGRWTLHEAGNVAKTWGPGTEQFLARGLLNAYEYGVLKGLDLEALKADGGSQ